MNEQIEKLMAGLAAQGYLIELLLLQLVHQQAEPVHVLDTIRFQLETQLRSDAARLAETYPGISATPARVAATTAALNACLDRIAGQFENPAPPKHFA